MKGSTDKKMPEWQHHNIIYLEKLCLSF